MTDLFTPLKRSAIMSAVHGRDTKLEIRVRSLLFKAGLRYRLHRKDLPGKPDIVLTRHRTVVFVHGCFWHGHSCKRARLPSTNADTWAKKIAANKARDQRTEEALAVLGWRVEVVWQCSLVEDTERVVAQLIQRRD